MYREGFSEKRRERILNFCGNVLGVILVIRKSKPSAPWNAKPAIQLQGPGNSTYPLFSRSQLELPGEEEQ